MNLEELVRLEQESSSSLLGREQKTLLAGMPKAGKTTKAASIAEADFIERVMVIDAERSLGKVASVLTPAQREKIIPILPVDAPRVPRTKLTPAKLGYPASAMLLLNLLCNFPKRALWIDQQSGRYSTTEMEGWYFYDPEIWESDTSALMIDNFSLIAEGFLTLAYMTTGEDKPAFTYYKEAQSLINGIMQGVVSTRMNIVLTTHVLLGSEEFTAKKVQWQSFNKEQVGKPKAVSNQAELYPLVLTQTLSRYFSGAFDNSCILHVKDTPKGRQHVMGSHSTYDALPFNCGSRFNVVSTPDTKMADFYKEPGTDKAKKRIQM